MVDRQESKGDGWMSLMGRLLGDLRVVKMDIGMRGLEVVGLVLCLFLRLNSFHTIYRPIS